MMPARKKYVGDGVYVEFDDYGSLKVTTENGVEATNTIILEPETWAHLKWLATICVEQRQAQPCDGDHPYPPCASAGCWHREPQ